MAFGYLAALGASSHTVRTYHRTWETGVGDGKQYATLQPLNLLSSIR